MYDDRNRGGRYGSDRGPGGQGGQGGRGGPYRGGPGRGERRGTPLSDLDPALTDMSRKVIGCAIEVHKTLGPGYPEQAYFAALRQELDAQQISYKVDHRLEVKYKDRVVGNVTADLFVGDRFIVEVMARVGEVGGAERSALRAQLKAADLELGLVINFGERRLKDGLVRVLNPDKLNAMRGDEPEHDDAEPSTHDFDGQ